MTISDALYRIRRGFRNPAIRTLATCLAAGDLAFITLFIICAILHLWALGVGAAAAYAIIFLIARDYTLSLRSGVTGATCPFTEETEPGNETQDEDITWTDTGEDEQ